MQRPLYVRREEAAREREQIAFAALNAMVVEKRKRKSLGGLREFTHLLRCQSKKEALQALPVPWAAPLYQEAQQMDSTQLSGLNKVFRFLIHNDWDMEQMKALQLLLRHLDQSVRPLAQWRPQNRKKGDYLVQLLRHLFGKYPVPTFLEHTFLFGERAYAHWYFEWTNGTSPRRFTDTPIPITKAMAHTLGQLKGNHTVFEALRLAQVMSYGATSFEALSIAEGLRPLEHLFKLAQNTDWHTMEAQHPERFLESVVRFLIANPTLILADYGPIMDYTFNQKYRVANNHLEVTDFNFSLKGRTAASVIRAVNAWHQALGVTQLFKHLPQYWMPTTINGLNHQIGTGSGACLFTIRELTRQRELIEEGKKMNHCVATYIQRCANGTSSIWAMECINASLLVEKLLTIEVYEQKKIVQVRGKHNRLPTPNEKKIVQMWAIREGLKYS